MSVVKQYPSLKQMKELTVKSLNKLSIEMLSPYWNEVEKETLVYTDEILGDLRRWYTIGRMIELIHYKSLETSVDYDCQVRKWFIEVKIGTEEDYIFKDCSNENLCDALWEMVIYFIEEE